MLCGPRSDGFCALEDRTVNMQFLAVVGGGGGAVWPPWAIILFLIVVAALGIFIITKLIKKRR